MRGTFMGLETARRSIQVHRLAMDITNHNLANAQTEGYTRQQAVTSASDPYANVIPQAKMTYGQIGTGVDAKTIRRVRDEYLEVQARDAASGENFWSTQLDICSRLEAVFPEPASPGIQELLGRFFNNWQELNNTPQDPGIKAAVLETGEELAIHFNETYTQLQNIYNTVVSYDGGRFTQLISLGDENGKLTPGGLENLKAITKDEVLEITYNGSSLEIPLTGSFNYVNSEAKAGEGLDMLLEKVQEDINSAVEEYNSKPENIDKIPGITVGLTADNKQLTLTGENVVFTENSIYKMLTTAVPPASVEITSGSVLDSIYKINDIVKDLADLNTAIRKVRESGNQPNDLMDRRDLLLRELAGYGPVTIDQVENDRGWTGEITVSFFGKELLAHDGRSSIAGTLTAGMENTPDGEEQLFIYFDGNEKVNLTEKLSSGEGFLSGQGGLTGYESSRLKAKELMEQLDTLANALKETVNNVLNPQGIPGQDFFTGSSGAADIQAAKTTAVIDGTKALKIAQLKDQSQSFLEGATFLGYYGQMLSSLGAQVASATKRAASQESIGNQINALIESISGVSLDEELSMVIQFQQGYNASARMMATIDEMLDTLINKI